MQTLNEEDPFIFDGDTILENGNSKSANLPTTQKKPGFQQFTPVDRSKTALEAGWELNALGTPEEGKGKKKRQKQASHKARAIAYLEGLGYRVEWVEIWVTRPDGFRFKQDWRGWVDIRGWHKTLPELRVNVCGDKADRAAHLRKFCNDKNIKRFREDVENPNIRCALLGFEMQPNKRYLAVPQRIKPEDIEGVLGRRRKKS
jgi:hypothetical protein